MENDMVRDWEKTYKNFENALEGYNDFIALWSHNYKFSVEFDFSTFRREGKLYFVNFLYLRIKKNSLSGVFLRELLSLGEKGWIISSLGRKTKTGTSLRSDGFSIILYTPTIINGSDILYTSK
jgi:hypothetical protein